jgi:Tfp pilus assembly protein PilP
VKLTGIVRAGGYSAIIEAAGRSYIVRPGDLVAYTFRVVAIGPDSVTLATAKEQRRITLGG